MPKRLVSKLQIKLRPQLFAAACQGANPLTNAPSEPSNVETSHKNRQEEKTCECTEYIQSKTTVLTGVNEGSHNLE